MLNRAVYAWIPGVCAVSALLVLFGCSSASKPYTLVAQLPALSQQSRIVAATIDVTGSSCSVRIMTLDLPKAWTPVCTVNKDQPTYKSLTIEGKQVEFGAVANGFKVLSTLPTLPAPPSTAPPAVTAKGATSAKGASVTKDTFAKKVTSAKNATSAPASATAAPLIPVVTGPSFPSQWSQSIYPGHATLQGQNKSYMVTSAKLTFNGSQGFLDVTFKIPTFPALHLQCTVVADQQGNLTLIFNPAESVKLSGGGDYNIILSTEGGSISGNIWDSHGFDSWTPTLPPQWTALSYSSD